MTIHAYTCALYNAETRDEGPPYVGPCDCGATDVLERLHHAITQEHMPEHVNQLLAECAITIEAYRKENASNLAKTQSNNAQIEADYDEYRPALLKYGHHLGTCAVFGTDWREPECTCGFEQARGKE
jgi:hypothetical protein